MPTEVDRPGKLLRNKKLAYGKVGVGNGRDAGAATRKAESDDPVRASPLNLEERTPLNQESLEELRRRYEKSRAARQQQSANGPTDAEAERPSQGQQAPPQGAAPDQRYNNAQEHDDRVPDYVDYVELYPSPEYATYTGEIRAMRERSRKTAAPPAGGNPGTAAKNRKQPGDGEAKENKKTKQRTMTKRWNVGLPRPKPQEKPSAADERPVLGEAGATGATPGNFSSSSAGSGSARGSELLSGVEAYKRYRLVHPNGPVAPVGLRSSWWFPSTKLSPAAPQENEKPEAEPITEAVTLAEAREVLTRHCAHEQRDQEVPPPTSEDEAAPRRDRSADDMSVEPRHLDADGSSSDASDCAVVRRVARGQFVVELRASTASDRRRQGSGQDAGANDHWLWLGGKKGESVAFRVGRLVTDAEVREFGLPHALFAKLLPESVEDWFSLQASSSEGETEEAAGEGEVVRHTVWCGSSSDEEVPHTAGKKRTPNKSQPSTRGAAAAHTHTVWRDPGNKEEAFLIARALQHGTPVNVLLEKESSSVHPSARGAAAAHTHTVWRDPSNKEEARRMVRALRGGKPVNFLVED
eukprot:g12041.t1